MTNYVNQIEGRGGSGQLRNDLKLSTYKKNVEKFLDKDNEALSTNAKSAATEKLTALVEEIKNRLGSIKKLTHTQCQAVLENLCDDARFRPTLASLGIRPNRADLTKAQKKEKEKNAYTKLLAIAHAADLQTKAFRGTSRRQGGIASSEGADEMDHQSASQPCLLQYLDPYNESTVYALEKSHASPSDDESANLALLNTSQRPNEAFRNSRDISMMSHAPATGDARDQPSKIKGFFRKLWSRIMPAPRRMTQDLYPDRSVQRQPSVASARSPGTQQYAINASFNSSHQSSED